MVDYLRALKRPFTDDRKLLIGIILYLPVPILSVVTRFIASGYALNCGKTASEGKFGLPEWEHHAKLWANAFVAMLIGFIYMIPVMITIYLFGREHFMGFLFHRARILYVIITSPGGFVESYGLPIIATLGIAIVVSYIVPMAVLNWLITGRFSSAFHLIDISKKVLNRKYFFGWLLVSVMGAGITILYFRFFPQQLYQEFSYVNLLPSLARLLFFLIMYAAIGFIYEVFSYTIYGNVLQEQKKGRRGKPVEGI